MPQGLEHSKIETETRLRRRIHTYTQELDQHNLASSDLAHVSSHVLVLCSQVTFDLCKYFVDEWILVTEEEISKAVYLFMENHHKVPKSTNNTLRHFALKSLF